MTSLTTNSTDFAFQAAQDLLNNEDFMGATSAPLRGLVRHSRVSAEPLLRRLGGN